MQSTARPWIDSLLVAIKMVPVNGWRQAKRILPVALFSASLLASDPWSTKDKVLEGTFAAATLLDWGQTLDIEKHPGRYEQNSLLGRHPSRATSNTYFATTMVLHALIADQLHGKYRTAWQSAWIGLEIGTVQRNYALGIRLNF